MMREQVPAESDEPSLTDPPENHAGPRKSARIVTFPQRRLAWRLASARSWFGRRRFHATRFLFVPPHLHLADPSIAGDFLSGQIVLGGRTLLTGGRSPFDLPPPCRSFSVALHGFEWLRHFDASGDPEIRKGARQLARRWMAKRQQAAWPAAEDPEAVPRRLIAWITHSALMTDQADFSEYQGLLQHLQRDAAMARVLATQPQIGMLALEAAIALLFHALALDRPASALRQAESLFQDNLERSLARDGGPLDRNPATAVRLAANLIPLLALYRARHSGPPEMLGPNLLRLISFIRMMQQPDGGLALFNGGGLALRDLVSQVTRFGSGRVPRLDSATESGFERLEDENGIVIADAGRQPPPGFDENATASALAFEFSTKADKLIVNCGIPAWAEGEVARSFRVGAAHSTLLIDDQSFVSLAPQTSLLEGRAYGLTSAGEAGPVERVVTPGMQYLVLRHDGLAESLGYRVERHLTLLGGGGLQGLDRIIQTDGRGQNRRITLAFHLHPRILPVMLTRQDGVMLRLPHQQPGRDLWLFEAPGLPLHLEESRCYDQEILNPRTEAIILDVPISGSLDIHWRLVPYQG
ncbi:MAG: heparinase II/III family protein [Beijerinckiaceae bacterium]|nr:heparinase II/III family protein [Beijerinckiaceae bacterium]MCZ8300579.1 heparinase II/III family protein [Beijerinckiaceae bacterium]